MNSEQKSKPQFCVPQGALKIRLKTIPVKHLMLMDEINVWTIVGSMVVDGSTYGDAVGCNMFSFPTRQI